MVFIDCPVNIYVDPASNVVEAETGRVWFVLPTCREDAFFSAAANHFVSMQG